MTDIVLNRGPKDIAGLAGRCVVDGIGWKPKSSLLRGD